MGQIHARGFDKDGNPRFGVITVNRVAAGEQRKPDVAMDDNGNFVVSGKTTRTTTAAIRFWRAGFNANSTGEASVLVAVNR